MAEPVRGPLCASRPMPLLVGRPAPGTGFRKLYKAIPGAVRGRVQRRGND